VNGDGLMIGRIGNLPTSAFATERDFREQLQEHLNTARGMFTARGGMNMFTLIVCTVDPVTRKPEPAGKVALWTICPDVTDPAAIIDPEGKVRLEAASRTMAKRGKAVCVLTVAEAAVVVPRSAADSLLIEAGVIMPRNHPDRRDAVWVQAEHRKWFASAVAFIEGPKRLGEWNVSYQEGPVKGRFSDILRGSRGN
jgi:hypothetical protein